MTSELDRLREQAVADIEAAESLQALDAHRVALLGKKGQVTAQLKQLGALAPEQRREEGARINRVKDELAEAINARRQALEAEALARRMAEESVDVTLPGRGRRPGAARS